MLKLYWSINLIVVLVCYFISVHLEEADLNFLKHWQIFQRKLNNSLLNILPWHCATKQWLIWTEDMEINSDYISAIMKCYLFVSPFLLTIWMFFWFISNKTQQYTIYLFLENCSTCFGSYLYPSLGAHTTVFTVSATR